MIFSATKWNATWPGDHSLPSWVSGNHEKVIEIGMHLVVLCPQSRWLSGQVVERRSPLKFLSILVKIKSFFSLALMKLIDILLFLPFVIVWKGLNCITCKWRDLILAHYLFISENEQNISGSRNEGGGAALMERDRQTIGETEWKCRAKGSWQQSIVYFFGLYWSTTATHPSWYVCDGWRVIINAWWLKHSRITVTLVSNQSDKLESTSLVSVHTFDYLPDIFCIFIICH